MFSPLLSRIFVKNVVNLGRRNISKTRVLFDDVRINATHKVNNFEKRCLVWTGKYKKLEDVPNHVPQDVMERARNKIRIRVANIMIVLTAVGCFLIIKSGQKLKHEGDSLSKRSIEWHQSLREERAKEESKEKL